MPSLPLPWWAAGAAAGLGWCWGSAEQSLPLGAEQTFTPMLCSAAAAPHKWVFPSALCSSLQRENKLKLGGKGRERENPMELTASSTLVRSRQWYLQPEVNSGYSEPKRYFFPFLLAQLFSFWLSFLTPSLENTVCSSINVQGSSPPKTVTACCRGMSSHSPPFLPCKARMSDQ